MKRSYWIAGGVVGLAMIVVVASIFLIGTGNIGSALEGKAAPSAQEAFPALPSQREGLGVNQLALGTLYLEDTDLAVTPEQAGKLLPLWQMLKALYGSDTSAQAEIDAAVTQLQKSMTAEQLQAIRDMDLTPEQMVELMESLGMDMQARASGGQVPGGFQGQMPPGGGGLGASLPGGGMPGAGPEALSPADIQAMRATRQASDEGGRAFMGRVNTAILEKLIELLQARAASGGG